MNRNSNLIERIEKSVTLNEKCSQHLPASDPKDNRRRVSRWAVSLALQHHSAISTLAAQEHFPSAQALLRPLLEAGTSAYWILYCANASQIEKIARTAPLEGPDRSDDIPMLREMLTDLSSYQPPVPYVTKMLDAYKSIRGRWLNKYTHGGISQIRRSGPNAPSFNEHDIPLALQRSDAFLLMSCHAATAIYAGDSTVNLGPLQSVVAEQHLSLYEEFPPDTPYSPIQQLPPAQ